MFWNLGKNRIPKKLAKAMADLAIEAYSFGLRFTMHAKLGLPITAMTARTEQQKIFDHEYIGIVFSWIGLALDMMDADLKFGNGPAADRYVAAINQIFEMIADRVHETVCPFESKAYLREAFFRYLPPMENPEAAANHIEFQFNLFQDNLASSGLIVDGDKLSLCLGERMLAIEPKIYSLTERYQPLIANYCRST